MRYEVSWFVEVLSVKHEAVSSGKYEELSMENMESCVVEHDVSGDVAREVMM